MARRRRVAAAHARSGATSCGADRSAAEPGTPDRTRAPRERDAARAWWIVAGAVTVLACLLYLDGLDGELLFDDVNAIVNNRWVRSGDVVGILTQASWWGEGRGHGWRPVTTLTFAANHALHGLAPFGYHACNVALHAAVSVLVFAVFARVTRRPGVAAVAALLFAAHPVHTEAVTSVVGRAELLAALGFFAAWLLFLRADRLRAGGGAALVPEALGAAVLFLAALAKENALGLVPVLVLTDLLFAADGARAARLRAHRWRYAALVGVVLAFVAARRAVLGAEGGAISVLDNPLVGLPPLSYELTAVKAVGLYAWRLLVPWHLAADYSYDQLTAVTSPLDVAFLAGCVAIGGVTLLAWWTRRASPVASLGLGMLVLTFAVVSNIVFPIGTIMAERLLYLPSAGFCLAVAVALVRMAGLADERGGAITVLTAPRLAVPLAVVLALYGIRTVTRNRVWHDRLALLLDHGGGGAALGAQPARARRGARRRRPVRAGARRVRALARDQAAGRGDPVQPRQRPGAGAAVRRRGGDATRKRSR